MDNLTFFQTAAALVARHFLTGLSGYLLSRYSISLDASTIDLVAGGASGLAAIAWSIWQKLPKKTEGAKE